MISPDTPAAADIAPSTTNGTSLTFDALKAHFPHVLDIHTAAEELSSLKVTSVDNWFKTDSKELVDPSALPRIIGRAYCLKYGGEQIDSFDVKRYLKNYRDGFAQKPIPLNRLGRLVADAVKDLGEGKKKKSPYLTFVHLKKRFAHLFPQKAGDAITFDTTTPVDTWFKTDSEEKVHPAAVSLFIGRIFTLKHGVPINTRYRTAHLNGSAQKPVELRHLPELVSKVIDALINGPTEEPERKLRDTGKEYPSFRDMSFAPESRLSENEKPASETIIFSVNSPEKVTIDARGRISTLKGTEPDKAKGTEQEICKEVYTAMRRKYSIEKVDDDMLRSCIVAAWDQLSSNGSLYECSKKMGQAGGGTKPINLPASRR